MSVVSRFTYVLTCIIFLLAIFTIRANGFKGKITHKMLESNSTKKLVCYFTLPSGNFSTPLPPGLNSTLCTHVIFIPATIQNCQIAPSKPVDVTMFQKTIPILRKQNPALKILISSCGDFSPVLESVYNRTVFVKSVIPFLRRYGFDGIDLDWEFPGWIGHPKEQRHNFSLTFAALQKELIEESKASHKTKLILSMAVSAAEIIMLNIYEFDYISKYIDFVNVMGYDYSGYTKFFPFTGYNSPLFPICFEKEFFKWNSLAWSATEWAKKIPKEKVIVGVPTYTKAFQLLFDWWHGALAPSVGPGICNMASYICACDALKNKNATRVFDSEAKVPYLFYKNQWITYDDEESLYDKTKWVMDQGFSGMMVYSMNSDDFNGFCNGKTKFPLISKIRKTMFG